MNGTTTPTSTDRGSRIFISVVLALLCALILSAVVVPLAVFRSRGEVMVSYGSVTVRRDLYLYWLSACKYDYLKDQIRAGIDATDTPAYWNGTTPDGITRAEDVRAKADAWIKRVVFSAACFEEEGGVLNEKQSADLAGVYERLLQYELSDKKAFDAAAKPLGFRYSTVRRALFWQTEAEIYVSPLSDDGFAAFCALAESEVEIRSAASKIDVASIGTDARLYSPAFLP